MSNHVADIDLRGRGVAAYRRAGYFRPVVLGDLVRQSAQRFGERTALVGDGQRWTYAQLDRRIDRLAAALRQRGLAPRDRVVVQLPNGLDFVLLCGALFRLGAVPVMALPAHRRSEVTYLCAESCAVAYAIADVHQGFDYRVLAREVRANVPRLAHVLVAGEAEEFTSLGSLDAPPVEQTPPRAEDVALYLLSGGTTGVPKLIPRTHEDYEYNVRMCAAASRLDETCVQLIVLPMGHNGALGCPGILGTLATGGTAVLSSTADPDEVFALIERERVTVTTLVPPLALLWCEAAAWTKADLSSLRLVQIGGAKLNPEVARRVPRALSCQLQQWYGMAEGILCHTRLDDPEDVVIGTQGRPLSPADEVRIVDDDERDLGSGEIGHLIVRGPTTFAGYHGADEVNRKVFTTDGYFRTGDLARRMEDGNLIIEGRAKDVINRGGEKVSAEELENHLLAFPAVLDVAVVAVPDAIIGERTCAFVIPRGATFRPSDLGAFLTARGVAAYKHPDHVEFVEVFPKTSVGKINKAELRRTIEQKFCARRTSSSSAR